MIRSGKTVGRRRMNRHAIWAPVSLALLFVAGASAAEPQRSDTATVGARLEIIQPIDVRQQRPLAFGKVWGGRRDGAIIITPSGQRYRSGGARVSRRYPYSAAVLRITGQPGSRYELALPDRLVAYGGHGRRLTVTDISAFSSTTGHFAGEGRLDGYGTDYLGLGARLVVPAWSRSGVYRAEIPLNISYD